MIAMEEIKKKSSQSRTQGTQRPLQANFRRKVCICECPDTLKHMVACDGCDHCMILWPPCMCQCAPQSDWYNIVQTEEHEYSYT